MAPYRKVDVDGVSSVCYRGSKTVCSMNLFDRFSRVAKSNLNNILKNLEDPEKIMNQAMEDMQVRDVCLFFDSSVVVRL